MSCVLPDVVKQRAVLDGGDRGQSATRLHTGDLPNVLLEAMALEVPIVATRVNGVPRLVQDGRNGFLIEPGDMDGLTTALAGLLKNQPLREVFARAARRSVETKYSFTTRILRLKRIYDELLSC